MLQRGMRKEGQELVDLSVKSWGSNRLRWKHSGSQIKQRQKSVKTDTYYLGCNMLGLLSEKE